MIKKIFSNKGFSMIELMVVVAIIGVLAAIGIPQYSKFQAKARQSEAKLALAALFTAEESFRQEWNQFSVALDNIGFSVQGSRLRYITGFSETSCGAYSSTLGAPPESASATNTWSNGTQVNTNSAAWAVTITIPSPTITSCSTTQFSAASYGSPASAIITVAATGGDTWKVNEVKLIQNTLVYLGN